MSTNPGVTSSPSAATSWRPRPSTAPTSVMRPAVMATSAVRAGAPVPSITVPARMTTSWSAMGDPLSPFHPFYLVRGPDTQLGGRTSRFRRRHDDEGDGGGDGGPRQRIDGAEGSRPVEVGRDGVANRLGHDVGGHAGHQHGGQEGEPPAEPFRPPGGQYGGGGGRHRPGGAGHEGEADGHAGDDER